MLVNQISIGRFHHFNLARQLEKNGLLENIWTGYPYFKLKDEQGIPKNKIKTFPWVQAPYMARSYVGLDKWQWLNKELEWASVQMLDKYVASQIRSANILIALSNSGLYAGKKAQELGGLFICDRGSSHITYQNQILKDEYERWGLQFKGIDPRVIDKEEKEYIQANVITVPSEFVRRTFIEKGVDPNKIIKIPYGARTDRFNKVSDPPKDIFRVLWVGGVSIRKGFLDALEAFQNLKHSKKEFIVVGSIESVITQVLKTKNLDNVIFKGIIPNKNLLELYSTAHVFVLPSIEEGLAMVQGEAMACGCPVISSRNSGGEDLFDNGVEGFIIPIRSPDIILDRFQEFIDNPNLREEMSNLAIKKVKSIGGWDSYGDNFVKLLNKLTK